MPHDAAKLLEDIRQAAHYVEEDTAEATLAAYRHDRRLQQLAERNFEIIGEAMRRLSGLDPALAARISGRREIIAFRNVLIHGYDVIYHGRVWQVIVGSLPTLRQEIAELLAEVAGEPDTDTSA